LGFVTGTRTNNLLDGLVVNARFGDSNFDDVANSTYGTFNLNTFYVDSNGAVNTISGLAFNKYIFYSIYVRTYGKNCTISGWKTKGASVLSFTRTKVTRQQ